MTVLDVGGWAIKKMNQNKKDTRSKSSQHDGLLSGITRSLFGDDTANGLQDFVTGSHRKDRNGKHSKGIVGDWFDDIFGDGSKAKADSASDIKKKSKKKDIKKNKSTYTKKQKDLLKQFNAMLDKAEKVIALAKSGGSDSG